jgi:hypothetical protein
MSVNAQNPAFFGDMFDRLEAELRLDKQERELLELKQRLAVLEAKCVLEYRGVWKPDAKYPRGAACTHDGGLWIAEHDTDQRPGNGATAWKLAVKKGNGAPPSAPSDPPARRSVTTQPRHFGFRR